MAADSLPTGRRGQVLALALAAIAVAIAWLGVLSPILQWYDGRSDTLMRDRQFAARMVSVAASAPALQHQLAQVDLAPPPRAVFEGATDGIAGAALQQTMQDIAGHTGATVLSAEILPVQAASAYHRIGVRLTVSAPWPQLVGLLEATLQATPRMLVDDLVIRQTDITGGRELRPMEAAFTVTGLHSPAAPAAAP